MADNNKMLIDATHPEETRVVVLRGGRVEEFDYESAARKLLRGNIYLAKVTRVEPALQAAFVDYGGNRHGFLAFNEIHPDYYQIPVADRLALIEEEAAIEAEEEAEADARAERLEKRRGKSRRGGKNRSGQGSSEDGSDNGDADGENDDDNSDDSDRDDEEYAELDNDAGRDADDDGDDSDDDDGDRDDDASDAEEIAASGQHNDDDTDDAGSDHARDDNDDDTGSDTSSGPKSIAQSMARDDVLKGDPEGPAEVNADGPETADTPVEASAQAAEAEQPAEGLAADAPIATEPTLSDEHADDASRPSNDDGEIAAQAKSHDDDENGESDDENGDDNGDDNGDSDTPEEVASEADAMEELPARPRRSRRSYKIQEVIKRRQVLLIQVVKEERGNKGAALTTYLSLAGRYTVLMPNTARGGGISRKITQPQDRKRLKAIANELEVPEGMGLIIRTAGAARTKQEIRRDFEYLLRLWESVREMTLQSTAPSLVYEEGDLIKRSIRDLYNKEIDEVIVAGDDAHRSAKDFMNMLMPSHAKNVTRYTDPEPLFTRYQIERQLNAMFSPTVTLKSGGYLVINQTEALVAVDVNSGRSTREFSIEETALHTNLEASDEIARQLKLRDLAGLIVIDFIDMEEKRNNRKVEHRLKDALRFDRARIQVGRISHFGLMEMSRQRMRTGVLEGSTSQCAHCQGTGIIRSTESVALAVLRGLEDAVMARSRGPLIATTTATVALYILNNKREFIIEMEKRHGWSVSVQASDKLAGANFTIEKGQPSAETKTHRRPERSAAVSMDWGFEDAEGDADEATAADAPSNDRSSEPAAEARSETDDNRKRRRRRRRGGRRGDRSSNEGESRSPESDDEDADDVVEASNDGTDDHDGEDGETNARSQNGSEANGDDDDNQRTRRGRRRGRRGGRRNRERNAQSQSPNGSESEAQDGDQDHQQAGNASDRDNAELPNDQQDVPGSGPQPGLEIDTASSQLDDDAQSATDPADDSDQPDAAPRKPRRRTRRSDSADASAGQANDAAGESDDAPAPSDAEKIASGSKPSASSVSPEANGSDAASVETATSQNEPAQSGEPVLQRVKVGPDMTADETAESPPTSGDADAKPTRRGWWQRRLMGE